MRDIDQIVRAVVGEILNSINEGVYLTDKDRRIVFWNRRAEEITGYKAEQVVGTRCQDDILAHRDKEGRPLCASDLCPLYRAMLTDRRSDEPVMVNAKSVSGEYIPLSVAVAPIHNEQGEVIGGIEAFRDERQNARQMDLARAVQRQMLTTELPADDRVSFELQYFPVDIIGGDYYRLAQVSDDAFALFLADVAGHGVSAALYAALLHSLVLECAGLMADPAAFMSALNVRICDRAPDVGLLTAMSVSFDAVARTATCCSAGHPSPLLQPAGGGQVRALESFNYPLGVERETDYENTGIAMAKGDRFLAYTDGAAEIRIDSEHRLGTDGLISVLAELPPGDDHRLTELYDSLLRRCATHMPEDDITVVSCMMV